MHYYTKKFKLRTRPARNAPKADKSIGAWFRRWREVVWLLRGGGRGGYNQGGYGFAGGGGGG